MNTRVLRPISFLFGLGLLSSVGCSPTDDEAERTTPETIQGIWTTEDERYADRRLEIMPAAILFYSDEREFEPYVIQELRVIPEEEAILYEIDHTGWEGGSMTLSLFVHPGDTTLVFRNQPFVVWKKTEGNG